MSENATQSESTDCLVQTFADRAEISTLLYRYGRGLDTLDWHLLGDIFTEDVQCFMEGPTGTKEGIAAPPLSLVGRDQFVKTARHLMTRLLATQHVSTHHEITINADRACSFSYMTAFHQVASGEVIAAGGLYKHEFVKIAGRWRIAVMRDGTIWTQSGLPQGAALFGLPRLRGTSDDDLLGEKTS